jgi:hypothetical protein
MYTNRHDHLLRAFALQGVRALSWRTILTLAVVGAILAAVLLATLVAAAGLFVLLLPVFVIGGLLGRFFVKREARRPQRPHDGVIEGHYEIVATETDYRESRGPGRGWDRR